MRLIDANAIDMDDMEYCGEMPRNRWNACCAAQEVVDAQPTIDPETLPIVQELQEQLKAALHILENTKNVLEKCIENNTENTLQIVEAEIKQTEMAVKLARYEQAEKQGRLIELPCEVGRTVYTLFCGKVVEKRIGQLNVNGYTNPRIWVDIDCDWATTQSVRWDLAIGKTIFLTREEAEAALEKSKTQ